MATDTKEAEAAVIEGTERPALGASEAVATLAVRDLETARKFYEGLLGFERTESRDDVVDTYASGDSRFFVYVSPSAGTNRATAVTWVVEDVEGLAAKLKERGVLFEHYDFLDMELRGDVHVDGDMKAAWFKDPDGNILAIVSS
jgi:catechol 2,3-dioxygenase-like lactoylglutathione lyase family enzyme